MALSIDLDAPQVRVTIDSGTITANRFVKAVPISGGDIHVVQAGLGDPVFGVAITDPVVPSATISDTFTRANSTTSLGTASDGGTWTVDSSGNAGIISNAAYWPGPTVGTTRRARRNTGQVAADVTFVNARTATAGQSQIWVAYDPATDTGYYVAFDSSGGSGFGVYKWASGSASQNGTNMGLGVGWTSGTAATIRVTYTPSTGVIQVFQNGVSQGTRTDPTPITASANSWVGFSSSAAYSSSGETWDNFSAVAAAAAPTTALIDRSFPLWHQVESGTTLSAGIPIMSDANGKAVAWDADPHVIVGNLVSAVTTAGNLATIDSSTLGSQSVGGTGSPVAASLLPRCYYSTTMSIPNSTHDATVFPQFNWVEWGSTGFHPFDLSDPKNPIVLEAGVYAVTVWIVPGTGASYFTSTIVTGAGMWGHLQLDATGNVAVTAQSTSLAAANTNGSAAGLTLTNTVYMPAGAVVRLYFSHNATDPSNFTMYATVQKLT